MKASTLLIYGAIGFVAWYWIDHSTSGIGLTLKNSLDDLLGRGSTSPGTSPTPTPTPITDPGKGAIPGGPPCSPPVLAFAQNLGVPCEAVRDWVIQYGTLPNNLDAFIEWANGKGWRQASTGKWHWGELWWEPGRYW